MPFAIEKNKERVINSSNLLTVNPSFKIDAETPMPRLYTRDIDLLM